MFSLLAISKTPAPGLLQTIKEILARFESLKCSIIFSALEPAPEAKIAMWTIDDGEWATNELCGPSPIIPTFTINLLTYPEKNLY
jgi:hypothetical protein